MKRILLSIASLGFIIYISAQESKDSSFKEYKTQEEQKYTDFEKLMIFELNNFIQLEEEWNMITISEKGNINEVVISNNENLALGENADIVISKQDQPAKPPVAPNYVMDKNVILVKENSEEFISPLKVGNYRVSSSFGYRIHPVHNTKKFHSGIDLAAPLNTPVYSVKSGVIVHSGSVRGYGNYIVIEHEDGYKSAYAHLQTIKVEKGDRVNIGSIIGTVGNSGTATGYHLHFELIKSDKKIDPIELID
jgi:murein DD-endopeptidase MepM/ murein hydrolase activator NlpD